VLTDTCEAPTLTAAPLSYEIYVIHTAKQTTPAFDDFLDSPIYCPVNYAMAISPSLPVADTAAITLDIPNRIISFESVNPALEQLYTLTISFVTPRGVTTATNFQFTVDFQDPCSPTTIDSGLTVFASPALTQNVW